MSSSPLVSVMIPAHKPAYLTCALESACAQSYTNLDIVIADDSGADEIAAIVRSRSADARINYKRNPTPSGLAGNYNFALQLARGRYGLFLDDDDLLYPAAVEKLAAAMQANPEPVMVYAGYELSYGYEGARRRIDRGAEAILQSPRDFYRDFSRMPPFTSALMFDIDAARKCRIFVNAENLKSSDWEAWLKIAACGLTCYVPEVVACHFRRSDGYSSIRDLGMDIKNADFIKLVASHAVEAGVMSVFECRRWQYQMQRWYLTWIFSNYLPDAEYAVLARGAAEVLIKYPLAATVVLANPVLITSLLLSASPSLHKIAQRYYRRLRFGSQGRPNF